MFWIRPLLLLPVLSSLCVMGQSMTLQGGTMTVSPGTRLELQGPIIWNFTPGATLVNNGEIDLGEEAVVVEISGEPITGVGTEHATQDLLTAFSNVDPGGLGLTLSMSAPLGFVEITRGHQAIIANGTIASIARWYNLDADPVTGNSLDLSFGYDVTELNGAAGGDLIIHRSTLSNGPWEALPSIAQPVDQTVTTSTSGPWDLLTLFAEVVTVGIVDGSEQLGYVVYPSLIDDHVRIVGSEQNRIESWKLYDAQGQEALTAPGTLHSVGMVINVGDLAAGNYFLRVNGRFTYHLVKP